MSLVDLPNEILERIATLLDFNSLIEFAFTHQRVMAVVFNLTPCIKLTYITMQMWNYLTVNGAALKVLDLSNCMGESQTLSQLLMKCYKLKKLNLVNTQILYPDLLRAIVNLPEIETLSFSIFELPEHSPLVTPINKLKHVYIETMPCNKSFDIIINFLNSCDIIEAVHVNFIGRSPEREQPLAPKPSRLTASKWRTLTTFVCSNNLTTQSEAQIGFLRRIFAAKLSENVCEWIQTSQACHVYERGYFNNNLTYIGNDSAYKFIMVDHRPETLKRLYETLARDDNLRENQEVDKNNDAANNNDDDPAADRSDFYLENIVNRYAKKRKNHQDALMQVVPPKHHKASLRLMDLFLEVRLTNDMNRVYPRFRWGNPKGMLLISPSWESRLSFHEMFQFMSENLVELDLSNCHHEYPQQLRHRVLQSVPSLQVLGLPLCFFLSPMRIDERSSRSYNYAELEEIRAEKREEADQISLLLQKLKLKKFLIQGRTPRQQFLCSSCCEILTSDNTPHLYDLRYLQELNINNVSLQGDALDNLVNPYATTIRLCLDERSTLFGFHSFLQRCSKLRNFKFELPRLVLETDDIWLSFHQARSLKQLCIGNVGERFDMEVVQECIEHIIPQLEFLHIHVNREDNDFLFGFIGNAFQYEHKFEESVKAKLMKATIPNLSAIKTCGMPQFLPGRKLCCVESFVGVVKPIGWMMNPDYS